MEKVGFDKFFHHFYDSKDLLHNSWKTWKKLSKPTFSTTQAVLEAQSWKMLVLPIMSKIFGTKFMETIGFRAGSTAKT